MRKQIVAGNWKMHTSVAEGVTLAKELAASWTGDAQKQMLIAPPFTHLTRIKGVLEQSEVGLVAQNCHWESKGAFTGEVSADMLKDIGVEFVIVGHSERREIFGENNEIVKKKLDKVLASGMQVILCCGEPIHVREAGAEKDYVEKQLKESVLHLDVQQLASLTIAYEPIWAIGTGLTATAQQAQEMHAFIRKLLSNAYSGDHADQIPILYGGSVKPDNAGELFAQDDVDGGLVGGASLSAEGFLAIASAL